MGPYADLYYPGMKMTVRDDILAGMTYEDIFVTRDMLEFLGSVVTVRNVHHHYITIEEDGGEWAWTGEMFCQGDSIVEHDIPESDLLSVLDSV